MGGDTAPRMIPENRRSPALRRAAVLLLLLTGALLAGVAPASAHPTILFTDPAPGSAVPESPPVITLVFNEAVRRGRAP